MTQHSTNPSKQCHAVAILMGAYNGGMYLPDQLNSFAEQSFPDWGLYVSDDGSVDNTKELIHSFASKYPGYTVKYYDGPKKGFSANFLSLVCNPEIKALFFAYSDQDDVWGSDKLLRATNWLQTIPSNKPALYCSTTEYVDCTLNHIAYSPKYRRQPLFSNAIVQNIASGNTMVFNQAARELICMGGAYIDIPLHDWWTYILVTGADGVVHFDNHPTVLYRQHQANIWGMNWGWRAVFIRIQKLFQGRFQRWNKKHIDALRSVPDLLTLDNFRKLELFSKSRDQNSLFKRLRYLRQSGVYRQTLLANIGLVTAVFFRKL